MPHQTKSQVEMANKYLVLLFVLCVGSGAVWAQQATVQGVVTTSDGKPAEFVNVGLKGTSKGDVTDKDGRYIIKNIQPGNYYIYASLVGAAKQEQSITLAPNETLTVNFTLDESATALSEITISDTRINKFYKDSTTIVAKMPLKDLENPQVYNSISRQLMTEQVVTNMNDAVKNATGITRLWESTGRGGDGAEYYSMRGFSVQPTLINGMPGINNGGLDPANVESIEVIKGPSGTLFGSALITYGGLINVTTKRPYETTGGEIGIISGSYGLSRLTADVNVPVNSKVLTRINTAYQTQNSFQDAGFSKSFFIAPSVTIKSTERLTFMINAEFLSKEAANAPMVFFNRGGQLTFSSTQLFDENYFTSYTSNDLTIKNPTMGFQAQALYKISDNWTSQTLVSNSIAKTDGYYHYLWDQLNGDDFVRFITKVNSQTSTIDLQQNFTGDFSIGNIRNRVLIGVDYFNSELRNSNYNWVGNGTVTLSTGEDTGALTKGAVDELLTFNGNSSAETQIVSAYATNVINFTPAIAILGSLRIDHFMDKTGDWNQTFVSPKFGIVYQPIQDQLSLFANYMNGFVNIGPQRVSDEDGSNVRTETFKPEQANQWEAGVKANFVDNKISVQASYYEIDVSNRIMTGRTNFNYKVQGGESESKGFEISVIANPVKGLNIIGGYSKNESEVTRDTLDTSYVGLRPEEAGPDELINYWVSYTLPFSKLKGLGFGIGGNSASAHKTLNRESTGTFEIPVYHVINASVFFTQPAYTITLKVNNLTDERYFSGWSTVTPQMPRNISLALNYRF